MNERTAWIANRVRLGWGLIVLGVALLVASGVLGALNAGDGWNYSIIGGLGILAAGFGIGLVVRYRPALRDEASARRIAVEERDERSVQIRTRAGNRAWIVSAVLVWIALMWVSFASNGGVPALADDLLWWYLVAAFLVPFAVYAGSITIDERRS
jgi:peptidoglycan/LPS O-acetylase OafA/YrhL